MTGNLLQAVEGIFPQLVAWRRFLHENPELSYEEVNTSRFIRERLEEFGLEVTAGVGGYGVVGILRGAYPGSMIALRADMDALPIQDAKTCSYASKVPGVMHACGHDGHTSMLLGTALLLSGMKEELHGSVKFIFQPAEETTPGGAKLMISDGVLEGVEAIYGIHLWTPFPSGQIFTRSGPLMAAADEFIVEVKGKGGHGGLPHETVDSLVTGAHLVVNLQTVVSRNVNPIQPSVLTIGSMKAGEGFNVITESCLLKGTVRSFEAGVRQQMHDRIQQITKDTCSMFQADFSLEYKWGYPPVINHPVETERVRRVANTESDTMEEPPLIMAAEDFAYYLQEVPGCFVFVGAGNPALKKVPPHHHPLFDMDESSMVTGVRLFIGLCLDHLLPTS